MSFVLYYPSKASPTTTVSLPNHERDHTENRIRVQASGRARGGTLYVYDKGTSRIEVELTFSELTNAEKESLQSFFDDDADGMVNAFQADDIYGSLWDARFLDAELEWTNLGERVIGSANESNATWSVTVRLQLTAT